MNTMVRFWCVLLTLAALAASPAYAATITLYDSYGNGNGGEFRAVSSGLSFMPVDLITGQAGQFETFCVEKNEYFSFGSTYYAAVSTAAISGGVGGGNPDPLDPMTAYLYQRFVTGVLADFTYSVSDGGTARAASADALQHVIWFIENEEDKTWTDGDLSLMDKYYQDAVAHAGTSIGDVRILNMWGDVTLTASPAQDQLVLTPEPTVTILAVIGLALLGGTRRRG